MAIIIDSGVYSSGATVNKDSVYVYEGGTADTFVLNNQAALYLSGGTVLAAQILAESVVEQTAGLFSGGIVNGTNGDCYYTISGGSALGVTIAAQGVQTVLPGAYVSETFISATGLQTVTSGAVVSRSRIKSKGTLEVQSGGSAVGVIVSSAATPGNGGGVIARVIGGDSDTLISGTNVNGQFSLSNGTATNFILYNSAWLTVEEGGSATGTVIYDGGILDVSAGASALNTVQNSGGIINFTVGDDAATIISGTNTSGTFRLQDNVASGFQLYSGAYQSVEEGGLASNTEIFEYGLLEILAGGSGAGITLSSGGELAIADGGRATGVVQSSGGVLQLNVTGGETTYVEGTNELGGAFLLSGGTASGFVLTSSSYLYVYDGGAVLDTVVSSGGEIGFYAGEGSGIVLMEDAAVNLYDGVAVTDVTLSGGFLGMVSGSIQDVSVLSGGDLEADGGTVKNVQIVNGSMGFSGTVTLAGTVSMTNEAQITCSDVETSASGLTFTYNIVSVASDNVLVEDFSAIAGAAFTISCDSSKALSDYLLAGNSTGYSDAFTLVVDNVTVDTLSIGSSVDYQNKTYSLSRDADVLTFSVSGDSEYAYLYSGASVVTYSSVLDGYTLDDSPYTRIRVMGGTAKNTVIHTNGSIQMESGAVASTSMDGGEIRMEDGYLTHLGMSGGSLAVEGGLAESITFTGGSIALSGGTLAHAELFTTQAGVVLSASGAAASRVAINDLSVSGGTTLIQQYADVNGLNVSGGLVNMNNNGVATVSRTTVSGLVVSGGIVRGNAGLVLNDVSIYDGLLWVSQTVYASNVTLYGGSMSARGNTPRLTDLHVSGGVLEVQHAVVNTLEVAGGTAQLYADNGAVTVSGITLSGGLLDVTPTGTGDMVVKGVVISGGTMHYDTTGTSQSIVVSGVSMEDGQVDMIAGVLNDLTFSGGVWNQTGGTVSGANVLGGTFGFSGGTISGLNIGEGGAAVLRGSVSDLSIANGGSVRISSGAVVSGAELNTNLSGAMTIYNGAEVNDLSAAVTKAYGVIVAGGARINRMNLSATVSNALNVQRYGQVNDLSMDGTGSMVRCSGVVSNAVVSGGVLKTFYYGALDGTIDVLSGGAVEIAYASNTEGQILGTVNLSSGARITVTHANNVSAKIAGTVNVSSGAFISQGNCALAVTGTVNLCGGRLVGTALDFSGGTLNFDLADAVATTSVYVSSYDAISGNDFSCTLNVAGFSAEEYRLFGGASGFARTIDLTVDGTSVGEIGLNTSALDAVHSRQYSLALNGKSQIVLKSVVAGGETAASTGTITTEVNAGADVAATWDDSTSYSSGIVTIGNSGNYGHVGLLISNDGTRGGSTTLCGGNATADVSGEIDVRLHQGLIGSVVGGALSAQYGVGGINLIIGGGSATAETKAVYAGGMGSVHGTISTSILAGAKISGQIYGGGMMNNAANNVTVDGDISFSIQGGTLTSDVIGGGRVAGNGTTTSEIGGGIALTISGGNFTGGAGRCIYAGGWVVGNDHSRYGADYTVSDGVNVSVSNATIGLGSAAGRGIFGGVFASSYGIAEISGGVNVSIENSAVGNVFGGGWAQNGASCSIEGDVNIQISGSTASVIYGGGAHALKAVESSVSGTTSVDGSVHIAIVDSTVSAVYAVGQVSGDAVTQDSDVTISGASQADTLMGCRYDGSKDSGVRTTLNCSDFSGEISKQVKGFDEIRFSGNGTGTFSCGASDLENENWTFDLSGNTGTASLLTWENGSMADDSIRLDVSAGNTVGWDICNLSGDDCDSALDGAVFQLYIDGTAYAGTFELDSTIENTGTGLDGMTLTYSEGILSLRGALA